MKRLIIPAAGLGVPVLAALALSLLIMAAPRQIPSVEKKPDPPFLGAYVADDAL